MGNNNNNNNRNQLFRNTCHPGLTESQYNQKDQTLTKLVKAQPSILDWYNDIFKLQLKTHLFLPLRVVAEQENMPQPGCCAQQNQFSSQLELKKISYPAFFYTLEKQIRSRKEKSYFREWQLWKLIIFISKACIEWQQVYANESLGVICPQNVVINSKGIVRLVCKISFYEQVYGLAHEYYTAPECDPNSIIKYTFNPSCQPLAVESAIVYSIGKTMLQAVTLVSANAPIELDQRLNILKNTLYSLQLKGIVQAMVRANQSQRPSLLYLLKCAKINRSKHE